MNNRRRRNRPTSSPQVIPYFADIPVEIVQRIFEHLHQIQRRDVATLRTVSRSWCRLANPIFFRTVSISMKNIVKFHKWISTPELDDCANAGSDPPPQQTYSPTRVVELRQCIKFIKFVEHPPSGRTRSENLVTNIQLYLTAAKYCSNVQGFYNLGPLNWAYYIGSISDAIILNGFNLTHLELFPMRDYNASVVMSGQSCNLRVASSLLQLNQATPDPSIPRPEANLEENLKLLNMVCLLVDMANIPNQVFPFNLAFERMPNLVKLIVKLERLEQESLDGLCTSGWLWNFLSVLPVGLRKFRLVTAFEPIDSLVLVDDATPSIQLTELQSLALEVAPQSGEEEGLDKQVIFGRAKRAFGILFLFWQSSPIQQVHHKVLSDDQDKQTTTTTFHMSANTNIVSSTLWSQLLRLLDLCSGPALDLIFSAAMDDEVAGQDWDQEEFNRSKYRDDVMAFTSKCSNVTYLAMDPFFLGGDHNTRDRALRTIFNNCQGLKRLRLTGFKACISPHGNLKNADPFMAAVVANIPGSLRYIYIDDYSRGKANPRAWCILFWICDMSDAWTEWIALMAKIAEWEEDVGKNESLMQTIKDSFEDHSVDPKDEEWQLQCYRVCLGGLEMSSCDLADLLQEEMSALTSVKLEIKQECLVSVKARIEKVEARERKADNDAKKFRSFSYKGRSMCAAKYDLFFKGSFRRHQVALSELQKNKTLKMKLEGSGKINLLVV
ncbi:hypothetical protein HDU76_006183 [Blyttiomyces sp. JEL0837]|nr:hypothetical protein HDU76_006183 [Blyttiomyces sp. JEL0837]